VKKEKESEIGTREREMGFKTRVIGGERRSSSDMR